jgi:two-component system CheB/CheR fusion protein
MAIFHFALKDRGYLFLGTSESVGNLSENFVSADSKVKIFLHRGQGVPPIKDTLRMSSATSFYKNRVTAAADPNAVNVNPTKQLEAQERYYQEIINELAPSCTVVKEDGTLVETFGRPDTFLRPQLGKVNFDIKKMVSPELSLVLTTGIRNAIKDRRRIVYKNVRLKDEEYFRSVNINISPLLTSASDNRRVLIAFEEVVPSSEECSSFNFEARADQHLLDLEKEIQFTKENLQATIEELQTSNEELQATNEELLASNEELQSTNEELNSVNEELNTVNAEYQSKITELSELNNDMDNLFRSTEIGTIFLDRELRIRKFTPAVTKEINLLRQDIGRPLSDLSSSLLARIYEDVRKVSDTSAKIEKTIRAEDPDVWYLIQILPYLDEKGNMGGVVISLVNITSQKKIEKAFEMQYDLLKRILETSPAATIMVNQEGEINFVNKQAEMILGFQRNRLLMMRIDSPELNITDLEGHPISDEDMPLAIIRKTKKQIDKYVMCIHKADGHQVVLSVNGNPIFNEKNEVDGAVFKFEKVAELNKN